MCVVKDENEEMSQFAAALSLFLKSPYNSKNKQKDLEFPQPGVNKVDQKQSRSRNVSGQKPILSRSATLGMTINDSVIGRVSRTKTSIFRHTNNTY